MPTSGAIPYRGKDHGGFEEEWGVHFVELLPGIYNGKFPDTVFKRGAKE